MKELTKTQKVKKHLCSGKTITREQAENLYNVKRMTGLIEKLRNRWGLDIETEMIYTGGRRYAIYKLK